ncbi:undecaprenyl-diphosphate phosphatase [Sphingobacterium griseoflavum]|uniref:Undecaprenyl-diphosphatase n=1 Tax=Sphingobacterium griseoflavum TaxID=1474952 RepID=A0ABQ3HYV3_9SPHI|nr:undecaprenyl-diphosphate phosphatase [Sphingobacterium griseoflavum]GHE36946.1 undecaprenyl-diphosphatase [Sphingobacterium griseoflavum]
MEELKALIVGIVQGFTEFLPVSSSGHIVIAQELLGLDFGEENLTFAIVLHCATALSTIVVFRSDIIQILKGLLKFNDRQAINFTLYVIISMIPAAIAGLFFLDTLEALFSNLSVVGCSLLITALLLYFADRQRSNNGKISVYKAFWIGAAQMMAAILPGLSRSGSTIATAVMLKIDRTIAARFSFLMVLPLIMGASLKKILDGAAGNSSLESAEAMSASALALGFVAAFVCGLIACKWMIALVKQAKLVYFSYYCAIVGISVLLYTVFAA